MGDPSGTLGSEAEAFASVHACGHFLVSIPTIGQGNGLARGRWLAGVFWANYQRAPDFSDTGNSPHNRADRLLFETAGHGPGDRHDAITRLKRNPIGGDVGCARERAFDASRQSLVGSRRRRLYFRYRTYRASDSEGARADKANGKRETGGSNPSRHGARSRSVRSMTPWVSGTLYAL